MGWPMCPASPAVQLAPSRPLLPTHATAEQLLDARTSWHRRPEISLIMSVHNAAGALSASLPLLFQHTTSCSELLLLLDQCSDRSYETAAQLISARLASARGISRARVWRQSTPVWEAAGESLLMAASHPTSAYPRTS